MLEVKEIPVSSGAKHPNAKFKELPNHEFTMGLIAPKGSGKTTLLINLLEFYKDYFNQIIIFSPTLKNDEKWNYVEERKYLTENKKLKAVIKKINKDKPLNQVVGDRPITITDEIRKNSNPYAIKKSFTGKIPEENFITEYSQQDLQSIVDQQQTLVDFLKEHGYTKHVADRILIIFDDLVGSTLFSSRREDPFKKLNTLHRHMSTSILMVSQAYKEIPRTVRTNFTCLILFKIYSQTEKDSIMKEYPMGLPDEQWEKVYDYCTEGPHDFLFFDIKKPRGHQIMKNLTQYVTYTAKKE